MNPANDNDTITLTRPQAAARGEYVYFIHSAEQNAVKIGYSSGSPRIHTLQTGNPAKLSMIGFFPAGREVERALHNAFGPFLIRGEWFRDDGLFTILMAYDIHDAAFDAEMKGRPTSVEEALLFANENIAEHNEWLLAGRLAAEAA